MRKLITLSIIAVSLTAKAQKTTGQEWVAGDLVEIDGTQYVVGGNLIEDGNFDTDPRTLSTYNSSTDTGYYPGWNLASNFEASLSTAHTPWVSEGGYDGGSYWKLGGCGGASASNTPVAHWPIDMMSTYYFGFYLKNYKAHVASANYKYAPIVSIAESEGSDCASNESNKIMGTGTRTADSYIVDDNDWNLVDMTFESLNNLWLQFRFSWANGGVCLDGMCLHKLYPANTDPEDITRAEYESTLNNLDTWAYENLEDYEALFYELIDYCMEHEEPAGSTSEEIANEIVQLRNMLKNYMNALSQIRTLTLILSECETLLEDEDPYPGLAKFETTYQEIISYISGGYYSPNDSYTNVEYLEIAINELNQALDDYRNSQVASDEKPADITYLVDNPTFEAQGKWYIGLSGGVQQAMTVCGVRCWQAWKNSANYGSVAVYQDITNLPNGYYKMSADMSTQEGCITDQHLIITSSTSQAVSPVLTDESMDVLIGAAAQTSMTWETLMTDKVAVIDGKLTIGAIGHSSENIVEARNDYRAGEFWLTNVKLFYTGPITEEDMLIEFNKKVSECEAQADTMHYALDKSNYQQVINENKSASFEQISDALDALNTAQAIANASETDYNSVINGTYAILQDSIDNANYYTDNAKKIAQVNVDYMTNFINSSNATYTETGNITNVLRYHLNSLIPTLITAENTVINNEEGRAALNGTINEVVMALSSYEPDTNILAEYVTNLQQAIKAAIASEITWGEGQDLSAYITNPSLEEGTLGYATGWSIKKYTGDGNGSSKGYQYDGNPNGYYINTNASTAGNCRANFYQVMSVPNGEYTLKAKMRNTGGGFYLFASTSAPITDENGNLKLDPSAVNVLALADNPPTNATKYINSSLHSYVGGDSIMITTNTYGKIWADAADKYLELTGVSGASEYGTAFDLISDWTAGEAIKGYEKEWEILNAREGAGYGWFYETVHIEVTDHILCIGVTNDSVFTAGLTDNNGNPTIPFKGTWISADDFELTMDTEGNNDDWSVVSGIDKIDINSEEMVEISSPTSIYSLEGIKRQELHKGINIIRFSDGKVRKIIVK